MILFVSVIFPLLFFSLSEFWHRLDCLCKQCCTYSNSLEESRTSNVNVIDKLIYEYYVNVTVIWLHWRPFTIIFRGLMLSPLLRECFIYNGFMLHLVKILHVTCCIKFLYLYRTSCSQDFFTITFRKTSEYIQLSGHFGVICMKLGKYKQPSLRFLF